MKKLLKGVFVCTSLFSISACASSYGRQIKEDEAINIASEIDNNRISGMAKIIDSTITEKASGETYKVVSQLKDNPEGEIYYKSSVKITGGFNQTRNSSQEVYIVKDKDYEEIFYIKNYDDNDNPKTRVLALTKKNNETYEKHVNQLFRPENCDIYYYPYDDDDWSDCVNQVRQSIANVSEYPGYKHSLYSTGKYDLTIKADYPKESNKGDFTPGLKTVTRFSQYGVVLIKEVVSDASLTQATKYTSSIKITLPSNWKQYLNNQME